MEERCSDWAKNAAVLRGRGKEGQTGPKAVCIRLSKGRQGQSETDGVEGQAFHTDLFCSGRTWSLWHQAWKKKNRSLIPVTQGGPFLLGLPALLWPQTLLRNRRHPWIDQTNSEPLVPLSKNYQSWFKSHPFSPVNTINSNGLNKIRGKNILPGEMKVEWKIASNSSTDGLC